MTEPLPGDYVITPSTGELNSPAIELSSGDGSIVVSRTIDWEALAKAAESASAELGEILLSAHKLFTDNVFGECSEGIAMHKSTRAAILGWKVQLADQISNLTTYSSNCRNASTSFENTDQSESTNLNNKCAVDRSIPT